MRCPIRMILNPELRLTHNHNRRVRPLRLLRYFSISPAAANNALERTASEFVVFFMVFRAVAQRWSLGFGFIITPYEYSNNVQKVRQAPCDFLYG